MPTLSSPLQKSSRIVQVIGYPYWVPIRGNMKLALSFLIATAALSAHGQITKSKAGYSFNIKYTKNQVIKYTINMSAVNNPKLASATQISTKCLDVDKQGVATLEVTTPAGVGQPPIKRKSHVDRHGRPVGNTIDGFSGNFMWPETPLKVGQTWRGDVNLGQLNQGQGTVKGVYKFAGLKKLNGKQVALVTTYIDVRGQFDIAGTGTFYVRVADGQLESATFNMGLAQYSESGKPTVLKLLMTIKTGAK